jgi:hypothetical protein
MRAAQQDLRAKVSRQLVADRHVTPVSNRHVIQVSIAVTAPRAQACEHPVPAQ